MSRFLHFELKKKESSEHVLADSSRIMQTILKILSDQSFLCIFCFLLFLSLSLLLSHVFLKYQKYCQYRDDDNDDFAFMNKKTCDINLKVTKIMFISPERQNHNLSSISCRGALTRVRASGVSVNREPVLGREEEDPPRKPCPKGVLLLKGGSSQITNNGLKLTRFGIT